MIAPSPSSKPAGRSSATEPTHKSKQHSRNKSKEYSAFLEAVIDSVCCNATSNDYGDYADTRNDAGLNVCGISNIGSGKSDGNFLSRHHRSSSTGHLNQQQQQHSQQQPMQKAIHETPLAESILPHLRFQSLPQNNSGNSVSVSSLHEFYNLFLADDAPHSFQKFHERNGDESIEITKWRRVDNGRMQQQQQKQGHRRSKSESNKIRNRAEVMERVISFTTRITPNSSSSSTASNAFNSNNYTDSTNSNNTPSASIPLGVHATQTLYKYTHQHPQVFVLQCEFSFDFDNTLTNNNNASSLGSAAAAAVERVGSRLSMGLSMANLGSLLISNDVKGSTVTVRVVLREGGVKGVNGNSSGSGGGDAGIHHRWSGGVNGNSGLGSTGRQSGLCGGSGLLSGGCKEESYLSCFTHPLLLPTDGLCASRLNRQSSINVPWVQSSNSFADIDEDEHDVPRDNLGSPAHIGASLLSAIKAKNANDEWSADGKGKKKGSWSITGDDLTGGPLEDAVPATPGLVLQHLSMKSGKGMEGHEDVLSTTSRGSLKLKQVPSFEMSRQPSAVSMRRMFLEKDGAITTDGKSQSRRSNSMNSTSSSINNTNATPTSQGLSMRIETQLNHPLTLSSSSLSSISRSKGSFAKVSSIDDKIRRGLKKRVSRTWISWAESWCMRLWEEQASAQIKHNLGGADCPVRKRSKVNVRPNVRRIGEVATAKGVGVGTRNSGSSTSSKASATQSASATATYVWNSMKGSGQKARKERWAFVEDTSRENECGVEVACTISTPRAKRDSGKKPLDHPKKKGIKLLSRQTDTNVETECNKSKLSTRWSKSPTKKAKPKR